VLGRSVLTHLVDLALARSEGPVVVHAQLDEHRRLHDLVADLPPGRLAFATGPPPKGAIILRTDRIYDPARLRRALRRGLDPERSVLWKLDQPHAMEGVEDELRRRQTYQPLGRFWALAPARGLARLLRPTRVRPNAVTLASAALMLSASAVVAFGPAVTEVHVAVAMAMALALVLDTADGHLARLQGTASEFGRWLDAFLDELCDMALHAAIAWASYIRDGQSAWLLAGMVYGMGKYLFVVGSANLAGRDEPSRPTVPAPPASWLATCVRLAGHADLRWHLWIVLAALGRLDAALVAYAAYFPVRALAVAVRKGVRYA
jgi:hypothetical protein